MSATLGGLHKRRRKEKSAAVPSKEEQNLAALLFGAADDASEDEATKEIEGEVAPIGDHDDNDSDGDNSGEERPFGGSGRAAWADPDDNDVDVNLSSTSRARKLQKCDNEKPISGEEYSLRLRAQFQKLNGPQSWATSALNTAKAQKNKANDKHVPMSNDEVRPESATDEEDDEDGEAVVNLMKSTGDLLERPRQLPKGELGMKRLKDANINGRSDCVVKVAEFHPERPLLLTAGFDRKLRLFDIDGRSNHLLQSVVLPGMPVHRAAFTNCGTEVIVAGRRPFFYTYDLIAGRVHKVPRIAGPHQQKSLENFAVSADGRYIAFLGNDGYVVLVSGKTKQWIGDMKLNGSVRAASFSPDGEELYTVGDEGEMYRWSMRTRRCLGRHRDEGNLSGSAIAVSPSGRRYAVGSSSGVVNIYDARKAAAATAATIVGADVSPLKAVMNLTTPVDRICFNHDSQIMAIASQRTQHALKLIHMQSQTTFANWPTSGTPLGFVTSMSFSARSGYFAVGNHKGNVLLYRLKHYTNA